MPATRTRVASGTGVGDPAPVEGQGGVAAAADQQAVARPWWAQTQAQSYQRGHLAPVPALMRCQHRPGRAAAM